MSTRPRKRSECSSVARPCPYLSCRYNLGISIQADGSLIRISKTRKKVLKTHATDNDLDEWIDEMVDAMNDLPHSCVLDAVELGPSTLQEVADTMGMTREGVRKICDGALRKLVFRAKSGAFASLGEYAE